MYCTKCGSKTVSEDQKFCIVCGNELNPVVQQPVNQVPVNQVPVNQVPVNRQPAAVPVQRQKKKKSKAKIIIPLLLFFMLIIGVAASLWIFNPNVKKIVTNLMNGISKEGISGELGGYQAENLSGGGLFADTDSWTFYANPELGGALCAISQNGEAPIQLTDFPVANINVGEDSLVFTDISGSYYTYKADDGSKEYSLPSGEMSLNTLLEQGEEKEIMFGGKLYSITGIKSLYENENPDDLNVYELDTNGSPVYSVFMVDGQLQYVYLSIEISNETSFRGRNYGDNTEVFANRTQPEYVSTSLTVNSGLDSQVIPTFFGGDDGEDLEDSDGEVYEQQGNESPATRDRSDNIAYWLGKMKDGINSTVDSWCGDFSVFQDDTTVLTTNGTMVIGERVSDSESENGFRLEEAKTIKGMDGWSILNEKVTQVNGITYIQVYKNEVSSDGNMESKIQIWAVDKKSGELLNTYPRDYISDMTVKDNSLYYKGEDGFLYEVKDGQDAAAISAMPIDKFEFLYNGDILAGYNQGDGNYSETVLSKNDYKKEAYNLELPTDGLTYLEDSGWYTHTDMSLFEKILPIHTYRGYYQTCQDGRKMEIRKDENGFYSWYRYDWDGSYEKEEKLALPTSYSLKNEALEESQRSDAIDSVDDLYNEIDEILSEEDPIEEAVDQEIEVQESQETTNDQYDTSVLPEAGVWVRDDGTCTFTLTHMEIPEEQRDSYGDPDAWFTITISQNGSVVASGYGFIPNVWLDEGVSDILEMTHTGDALDIAGLSTSTFDGMYYRE